METSEALEFLKTKLAAGEVPARDVNFVSSLVEQAKRRLSSNQWYWVVKLAEKLRSPGPTVKSVSDFSRVYSMFAKAREHLKFPKVLLTVAEGQTFKLYVSGERSRVPNTVNVVHPESETWFGRVYADGRWEQGRGTAEETAAVEAMLTKFAADPEGVAAEHGKLTGACCFCNRKLSDDRSTAVGYGQTCAKKFGLKWGK